MSSVRLRRMVLPAGTLVAGAAALAVLWIADPTSGHGFPLPPCPSKLLFGLDCPGCGGSRMVFSLLHGDLPAALHYNALALAFVPLALWSWSSWVAGRWQDRRFRTWEHWRWTPAVALTLLGVWTVVRNLPFPPFDALYV